MRIIFGIIGVFLSLPMPLRVLVELSGVTVLSMPVCVLLKWIFAIILEVLRMLNKFFTMTNRYLICKICRNSRNVYVWDEKIGRLGGKIDRILADCIVWLKKCKVWKILKNRISLCLLLIIYVLAILPSIPLERVINDYYLEPFYGVSEVFANAEGYLKEKAEDYPPLFILRENEQDVAEEAIQEQLGTEDVGERFYLLLNSDISFANIRQSPELDSEKVGTVSKEDVIIYENEYKHDSERYWLKVIVESQNNLSGWISAKVIEKSVIEKLNLQ